MAKNKPSNHTRHLSDRKKLSNNYTQSYHDSIRSIKDSFSAQYNFSVKDDSYNGRYLGIRFNKSPSLVQKDKKIDQFQEVNLDSIESELRSFDCQQDYCQVHGKKVKAFCTFDNQFLCLECLIENKHKNHSFLKVDDYVEKMVEEISGLRDGLGLKEGLDGFEMDMEKQEKKMIKSYNLKLDEIEQDFQKKFQELVKQKEKQIKLMEKKFEAQKEQLKQKRFKLEEIYQKDEQLQGQLRDQQDFPYWQQVQQIQMISKEYKEISKQYKQISLQKERMINQTPKQSLNKEQQNPLINQSNKKTNLDLDMITYKSLYQKIETSYKNVSKFTKKIKNKFPWLDDLKEQFNPKGRSARQIKVQSTVDHNLKENNKDKQFKLKLLQNEENLSLFEKTQQQQFFDTKELIQLSPKQKLITEISSPKSAWFNQAFSPRFKSDQKILKDETKGKIISIVGGQNPYSKSLPILEFNIETNSFKISSFLPQIKNSKFGLIWDEDKNSLITIGGKISQNRTKNIVEFLLDQKGKNFSKNFLDKNLSSFAYAQFKHKIYIAGGNDGIETQDDFLCFDLKENKLSYLPSVPIEIEEASLSVNPDGKTVYLLGGFSSKSQKTINYCFKFNTIKKQWFSIAPMNQCWQGHWSIFIQNWLFVIGGYESTLDWYLSTCEVYNETWNEWTQITPMNTPRCLFSLNKDPEETALFVFGGFNSIVLDQCEQLDLNTLQWTQLNPLPEPRCMHESI